MAVSIAEPFLCSGDESVRSMQVLVPARGRTSEENRMNESTGNNRGGALQLVLCLAIVVTGSLALLSFGVYSPHFVLAFDSSVATVSIAASLVLVATGLASPVVGRLLDLYTVRQVCMAGAAFFLAGLVGVSFALSTIQLLLCYSLAGIGVAILSPLVAVKHMTDWFPHRLGLATSLVVLPLGAVLFPPLTQWLIEGFGWRRSFQIYAAGAAVVVLLLLLLRSAPERATEAAGAEADDENRQQRAAATKLDALQVYKPLLASPLFWYGMLAFCVYLAAPISLITHMVGLAVSKKMSAGDGVLFLTIMGLASIAGAPVAGLISDRFGARANYMLLAAVHGLVLLLLLGTSGYMQLLAASIVLGFFMSGAYVFFVGFVTPIIGSTNFGTGFGLATLITAIVAALPPVVAGAVFDFSGSYDLYFGALAALSLLAGILAKLLGEPGPVEYPVRSS